MDSITPTKKQIFAGTKPIRLGIFSSSGSGKSHLISHILTNKDFGLQDKFEPDKIFIICPTLKLDDSYDKIKKNLEQRSTKDHQFDEQKQMFHENLEQNMMNTYNMIFEEQAGKKAGGLPMDHYLMILDDIALQIPTSSHFNQLTMILTKIRHLNCSIIIALQHYKMLSSMGRNQLSHLITFNISLNDELKKITNEVSGSLTKKQFLEIYEHATREQYGFLLICMQLPQSHRFFSGKGEKIQQLLL